eukprot:CAMPEP_0119168040 /NCGR_PEP_ID=MMETSP1315-20130426/6955_1 /TAXON_ID=676789 /ORGANISM="Prasinoderma singularis, Strain RCC927" /LENGTH=245 /DNA_ID=CAMNT_0007161515 /DNA_START=243 /DNA_END=980 /DNA_ORIENTATION=-
MSDARAAQAWLRDFDEAKALEAEANAALGQRSAALQANDEQAAARLASQARRRVNALRARLDALAAALRSPRMGGVTERELQRRADMVERMRARADALGGMIARPRGGGGAGERDALFGGRGGRGGGASSSAPQETERTAALDNAGLLTMQEQVMSEQDDQLEDLSRIVGSTKHVALAVNEELDVHNRLLDDLDRDTEATGYTLKRAQRRLKGLMAKATSNWTLCIVLLLVIALVVVCLFAWKLV